MPIPTIRILVADDISAWRVQVRALLADRAEWEIVAEACDGLEAVRQAAELRTDLVLLDVGMPSMNGLAAARKIRQQCPECRIVFVTQNDEPAIMKAALSDGAHGFVVKGKAATHLRIAIAAALHNTGSQ